VKRWLMEPVYLLGKPETAFDRFLDDVLFVVLVMWCAWVGTFVLFAGAMYALAIWG
jgi:hypothetical protein